MPVSLSSFDKFFTEKLSDLFKTANQVSSRAREKAQAWEHLAYLAFFLLYYGKTDMDQEGCVAGHSYALPVNFSVPSLNCYLLENCTPIDYRKRRSIYPS